MRTVRVPNGCRLEARDHLVARDSQTAEEGAAEARRRIRDAGDADAIRRKADDAGDLAST
jgi:hypothetical protein